MAPNMVAIVITQLLQTSVSVPGLLNTRQLYIIHPPLLHVTEAGVLSSRRPFRFHHHQKTGGTKAGLLLRFLARLSLTELSCLT